MNSGEVPFRFGYHRSLDGLRGIAVSLVLLAHGLVIPNGFAFFSVNTFFVLSGFLITSLLVAEWDLRNDISLKNFYLRRALRLLPALTVMLLLFVIFVLFTDPYKRAVRELYESLRAFFYFSNWAGIYKIGRLHSLAHTWSLSIEEQFYIVWPGILLLLLRKSSRQSMLCWIFLGAFLSVMIRIGLHMCGTTNLSGNILPLNVHRLIGGTDARADSLLLGCFAGVLVSSDLLPRQRWFQKLLKLMAYISGVGLLILSLRFAEESKAMIWYGWFLASVFAMTIILHLVSTSNSAMHWCLENKWLVYTGQISYGLYVWHFPILKALEQHNLPWHNMVYLLPVIPFVLGSYYLIEKPCLKLKKHFHAANAPLGADNSVILNPKGPG